MGGGWNWLRDRVQWRVLVLAVLNLLVLLPESLIVISDLTPTTDLAFMNHRSTEVLYLTSSSVSRPHRVE
jgi:hypothetical protein